MPSQPKAKRRKASRKRKARQGPRVTRVPDRTPGVPLGRETAQAAHMLRVKGARPDLVPPLNDWNAVKDRSAFKNNLRCAMKPKLWSRIHDAP